MMKKNVFALLLALVLLTGAGPAARAAGRTELYWENSSQTGKIYLDLRELNTSAYGIQLELTLDGSYPDCVFQAENSRAYAPACTVDVRQGETDVVIYITDTEPLNNREDFTLGTLDLGIRESVGTGVLPENASITVLDRNLTGSSERISVTGTGRTDAPSRPEQDRPNDRPENRPDNKPENKPDNSQKPNTDPRPSSPEPSQPDTTPATPLFNDVQEKDWFYGAVQFVYGKGMMSGTGAGTFAPYATTTRGMIVTILHRLEGSPAEITSSFTDVLSGEYYAAPVAWASANKIVTGYSDGTFQPNAPITREQLAAILYRYAQYKNADVSRRAALTQFSDQSNVSAYAVDAMSWSVDAGLITGIDGRLEPAGYANRAQVATILMRLCENVLIG